MQKGTGKNVELFSSREITPHLIRLIVILSSHQSIRINHVLMGSQG
jgi:hypothetical protein